LKKLFYLIPLVVVAAIIWNYLPEDDLPVGSDIDRMVVEKSKRRMSVYAKGVLLKTYPISLGGKPVGEKQYEGDMKTPEGEYFIDSKNANSKFFKNLGISYPNGNDLKVAKNLGRPAGGEIKIHGLEPKYSFIGKFQRFSDWTNGCIALTNAEMEDLFDHVSVGTSISIRP
jgi:murein L,D-transpeptidase YafK